MSCERTAAPPKSETMNEQEVSGEDEDAEGDSVTKSTQDDDSDGESGSWVTEDEDSDGDGSSWATEDDEDSSDANSWTTMYEYTESEPGSESGREAVRPWTWTKDWWRHDFEGHRIFMILTPLRPNGFTPEAWKVHDEAAEAVVATLNAANLDKLTVYPVPAHTAQGPGVVLQFVNPSNVHLLEGDDTIEVDEITPLFEAINACTLVSVTMDCADDYDNAPYTWPTGMIEALVGSLDQPHLVELDLGRSELGDAEMIDGLIVALPRLPRLKHLIIPAVEHDNDGSVLGTDLFNDTGTTSLISVCDHGEQRDMGEVFTPFDDWSRCDCRDLKRNNRRWLPTHAHGRTRNRFLHHSVRHAAARTAVNTLQLVVMLKNAKPAGQDTPDGPPGIYDMPTEVLHDIAVDAMEHWALTDEQTARAARAGLRGSFPPWITAGVWADQLDMLWDKGSKAGSQALYQHGYEWSERYFWGEPK